MDEGMVTNFHEQGVILLLLKEIDLDLVRLIGRPNLWDSAINAFTCIYKHLEVEFQ